MPIDRIMEFQGNLKKISKKNLEHLKTRILEDGFNVPFFVWDNAGEYKILDGHQRLKALLSLREEGYDIPLLPVALIDAIDESDARKKLLAISSQYGQFDSEELAGWLDEVGNSVAETLRLVDSEIKVEPKEGDETTGDDDVAEVVESVTELGDVWELGSGILLCGDSTKEESVEKVMNGELADLWITDPPYNVNYTGKTKDALKIENDKMDNSSFLDFLINSFKSASSCMKAGSVFYIWHSDSEGLNFRIAAKDAGLETKECLIWNKQTMVMGRQDYQWKHEPCLYGWKEGAAHNWYSDRKQTTVLDFNRPSVSKEHPTMKPVELFSYQIQNSSKKGDIVLDTFAGSGTTLIACEKLERKARVIELDPHYCDVIVGRYIKWAKENGRDTVVKRNGIEITAEEFFHETV